ncbi:OmpA family protein [Methylotetracoccus oryzae]|uniref:OmpA family protein n=1 Tax=Methylotetracoccus oryzae TaxID=1919059 RepID=UPI00111ACD6E|nr:OmpA family protein [Methylotetracoccus oryzae]
MASAYDAIPSGSASEQPRRRDASHQWGRAAWLPTETSGLLGLIRSRLDEAVLQRLACMLHSGLPQARSSVEAVLPPLLVGLIGVAARPGKARRVAEVFEAIDESLLERLATALDPSGLECIQALGRQAMNRLVGHAAASRLVSRAARYAQLDNAAARALLETLTPVALAAAKSQMRACAAGSEGLSAPAAPADAPYPPLRALERPYLPPDSSLPAARGMSAPFRRHGVLAAVSLAWCLLLGYWALSPMSPIRRPVVFQKATSATLSLSNVGAQVEYAGVVDNELSRARVLEMLADQVGENNLVGELRIDARVPPPPWLGALASVLSLTRQPGVDLLLSGSRVDVTAASLNDGAGIVHRLRALWGDHLAIGLRDRRIDPLRLAELDTGAPLADLETILGAWVIHFTPDSDEVPSAHRPLIRRVAYLMDRLPEGVVVDVCGHTDDTGDAAVNLTLSQVRAESVREALIDAGANPARLRVRGYGSQRPVAGNDRPHGRSMNRRIEFVLRRD